MLNKTNLQKDIEQKEFYSAIKYPGPRSTLTYLWAKRIEKYFKKDDKFVFLDAGCGAGNDVCAILSIFKNSKAFGVDQSNESLKILKNRAKKMNVSERLNCINQSYLEEFDIKEKADISFAIGTIGHSSNPDLALKNILKNTKKNGYVALMLYSDQGTYEKNKLISALNLLNPDSPDEFLNYIYSYEKKYPKFLHQSLFKTFLNLRNFISHYIKRFIMHKSYGYLESLPKDTLYKDTYITKIEKSFSFEELLSLVENNNLEIIDFFSHGKIDINKIPNKWRSKWKNLNMINKAKISSLINPNPTSWSIIAKRINF